MKVLHVLDCSIPELVGYSIRSKYIVDFQAKMGLTPVVATSPKYERSEAYEEINGIPYYRSYSPPYGIDRLMMAIPFAQELRIMAKLHRKLDEICHALKIDILHAHSPSLCGLPALKIAERMKLPLVYEVRALWEDAAVDLKRFNSGSFKYKISRNLEQRLFRNADAIVCICEGLKNEIALRTSRDKIYVIQNGVDTATFTPRKKAQDLIDKYGLQNKVVIGFIGSFFTFEGLADLVQSIPKIVARKKNVCLLIVGGGVEETNLRHLAGKLGISDGTVIFTGRVPHEQIQNYYSIIDILVYPRISKRITELVTPLKPLEAMAMEKTVVASDVGGLKELIRDGETGVLFKAGNIDDLAQKITNLTSNESKRKIMGKKARSHMIRNREWSAIVAKYLDIYEQVLKGKGI